MKYSSVILTMILMLSSVDSLRILPYIILKDMSVNPATPPLPTYGWSDPFIEIADSEFELLCEVEPTAQKIKYHSQHASKFINLMVVRNDRNRITIRFTRTNIRAYGRKCENREETIFFMINMKYIGPFSFSYESYPKGIVVLFEGIITNYLSYEDAGKVAFGLFGNSEIEDYIKEPQLISICASLFQGLSSALVQSRESYYIRKETQINQRSNYLYCEGAIDVHVFIQYKIYFTKLDLVEIITVSHVQGNAELTETNTFYWN